MNGLGALAIASFLLAASPKGSISAETSRLAGHTFTVSPDGKSYAIDDIAGEGKPWVGTVERIGTQLWLRTERGDSFRLAGPLARRRIAGPRYKVWVIGEVRGDALLARRLGVLRPPGNR